MSLTAGIVGLPNVGKSTLFNAITNSRVEAANYPFATIEPNVGIVEVRDERLTNLSQIFEPERTIYTTFEFTDIAGLVKGASKGEGLGNQFLANIREVDMICHVVRWFENNDISHVYNRIDPEEDAAIINMELIMADLQSCENRMPKVEKRMKAKEKGADTEYRLLNRIKECLEQGHMITSLDFEPDEAKTVKGFLSVELSMGQMIEDVRLATCDRRKVELCCRTGGMIMSPDEVLTSIRKLAGGDK